MAFPATIPANRTFHVEDKQLFHVKDSTWVRHRGKTVLEKTGSGGINLRTNGLVAQQRITINSVFKPTGDASLLFNVTDKDDNWLPMNRWYDGAIQLLSGNSSWRNGDWKAASNPTSAGYYLNWSPSNDWLFEDGTLHTTEINIVDCGDGSRSIVNWTAMGKGSSGVWTMRGNASIDVHVHEIGLMAYSASSGFSVVTHHVELI